MFRNDWDTQKLKVLKDASDREKAVVMKLKSVHLEDPGMRSFENKVNDVVRNVNDISKYGWDHCETIYFMVQRDRSLHGKQLIQSRQSNGKINRMITSVSQPRFGLKARKDGDKLTNGNLKGLKIRTKGYYFKLTIEFKNQSLAAYKLYKDDVLNFREFDHTIRKILLLNQIYYTFDGDIFKKLEDKYGTKEYYEGLNEMFCEGYTIGDLDHLDYWRRRMLLECALPHLSSYEQNRASSEILHMQIFWMDYNFNEVYCRGNQNKKITAKCEYPPNTCQDHQACTVMELETCEEQAET